ncbi:MAG: 3-deoxy-8-phosphooctulonate synthase [Planctomycetota bacterium]
MPELRKTVTIAGNQLPAPVWIIGPDVIENEDFARSVAAKLQQIAEQRDLSFIYKASFEKANRSSSSSFRGPGLESGLKTLQRIKDETGLPILSDIHGLEQINPAAEVLDVLQIPAFLCRQNALLEAAAATGRTINLKKGQFLAPWDIASRVAVLEEAGAKEVWVTERGVSFGYQRLVNDFRVVPEIHRTGAACIFDATHSVQTPGGLGATSGGEREFIPVLARAAAAAGADGFFFEVHPSPADALCDGPNSLPLDRLTDVLDQLEPITRLIRELPSVDLSDSCDGSQAR